MCLFYCVFFCCGKSKKCRASREERWWLPGWSTLCQSPDRWVHVAVQKNSCTFALPHVCWDFVVLAGDPEKELRQGGHARVGWMKEWSLVSVWPLLPTIYIFEHYRCFVRPLHLVQTIVLVWPSGPPLKDALHICRHVCILDSCVAARTSCNPYCLLLPL